VAGGDAVAGGPGSGVVGVADRLEDQAGALTGPWRVTTRRRARATQAEPPQFTYDPVLDRA